VTYFQCLANVGVTRLSPVVDTNGVPAAMRIKALTAARSGAIPLSGGI